LAPLPLTSRPAPPPTPPSSPTRRSSDLCQLGLEFLVKQLMAVLAQEHEQLRPPHRLDHRLLRRRGLRRRPPHDRTHHVSSLIARSEEHTSELQSLAYLVCRLLLEKKKQC